MISFLVVMLFVDMCLGVNEFGKSPHDNMYVSVLIIGNNAMQQ
jgi:hypothetical protein